MYFWCVGCECGGDGNEDSEGDLGGDDGDGGVGPRDGGGGVEMRTEDSPRTRPWQGGENVPNILIGFQSLHCS